MSFQEKLRLYMRTKNDIKISQEEKILHDARKTYIDTVNKIKDELLNEANKGNTLVDKYGQKQVSCLVEFVQDFLEHEVKSSFRDREIDFNNTIKQSIGLSKREQKNLWRQYNSRLKSYPISQISPITTEFRIKRQYETICYQIVSEIQQLVKRDAIEISLVLANFYEGIGTVRALPCIFNEESVAYSYYLALKATAKIIESNNDSDSIEHYNEYNIAMKLQLEKYEEENASTNNKDIDVMDGYSFEQFCADLLMANRFDTAYVTPGSRDQGIDVIAERDGIKYGVQCKCYSSDVGNKAVQEAFAGKTYYDCHLGVVLTNRYFTRSAVELAKKNGIILWDRDKLLELIKNAKRAE